MQVRKQDQRGDRKGFTLIEILVVILILGMILTAVGTNVFGIFGKAKRKSAENEIRIMVTNIRLYKEVEAKIPETLEEISEAGYFDNVEKGEVPIDPWNRPYQYQPDPSVDDGFLLWSTGEKLDDEEDDIRSDKVMGRHSNE